MTISLSADYHILEKLTRNVNGDQYFTDKILQQQNNKIV